MKIYITMKTPDCLDYASQDLTEEQREDFIRLCQRWFKYDELVTLVVDTEKETCEVEL